MHRQNKPKRRRGPCKSLALQLATIAFTGRPCLHYPKPSKSPLLFPAFFYTALPAEPCQTSFRGVGGTRASAHLYKLIACAEPLIWSAFSRKRWNSDWVGKCGPLQNLSLSLFVCRNGSISFMDSFGTCLWSTCLQRCLCLSLTVNWLVFLKFQAAYVADALQPYLNVVVDPSICTPRMDCTQCT